MSNKKRNETSVEERQDLDSERKKKQEWNEIKWYGLSLYLVDCVSEKLGSLLFFFHVCRFSYLRAGLIGVRELNLRVQHIHTHLVVVVAVVAAAERVNQKQRSL
jgi:hypothetical protein